MAVIQICSSGLDNGHRGTPGATPFLHFVGLACASRSSWAGCAQIPSSLKAARMQGIHSGTADSYTAAYS